MKVAVQQALFHHFVQPVSKIAGLAAIHPRTAWNHIHAARKSHVKSWASRPSAERDAAIAEADQIVKGNLLLNKSSAPNKRKSPTSTRRSRIPAPVLHAMIDTEIAARVQANDTFTAYAITKRLRSLNPANDIVHREVQARVRYVMTGYINYEVIFQNWSGKQARTWRPTQTSASAGPQAVPASQRLWECEFCGSKDVKGAACPNCGAPRPTEQRNQD